MRSVVVPIRRPQPLVLERTDDDLVSACAAGDLDALGTLFDRFHEPLHRFLARLAGTDRADLDDLVQSTFLEVFRAAARFTGRSGVRSWVFGIALNLWRHHVRDEVMRKSVTARLERLPHRTPTGPDLKLERRQILRRLEEGLALLPDELRAAYVMCAIEQLPAADVAEVLGVKIGTLWRRVHEARTLLRAHVERSMP